MVQSPVARTRQPELATAGHIASVFKKLRTIEACWGSAPFLPFIQYRLPCPRNGPIPTLAESFLHQSTVTLSLTVTARCDSRLYPVDNKNQHSTHVLFSSFIAVIDMMTEITLGKKERAYFSLLFHITVWQRGKSRNELKPDRNLKVGTETDAMEGHCLLACSACSVHSELGPPTFSINQEEDAPQACSVASQMGVFPQLRFPLPK